MVNQLVNDNPCGICRAMGRPAPCRGHRGGSNNEEEEENRLEVEGYSKQALTSHATTLPEPRQAVISEWLTRMESSNASFQVTARNVSIKLDRMMGQLNVVLKDGLSPVEASHAQAYLLSVYNEFEKFCATLEKNGVDLKGAHASLTQGELRIEIPKQQYFDLFIHQLLEKELLPTCKPTLENASYPDVPEQEADQSNAPNPFVIS